MPLIDLTARYPVAQVSFRPAYGSEADIDTIVIHHLEFGDLPENATQAQEIAVLDSVYAFHVNTRGWGGIGYGGIAFRSGRAYITADWSRWGTHTYKENNHTRGFAVAGDWSNAVPPASLQASVAQLVTRHDAVRGSPLALKGHRDYVATICPGNPYQQWVPNLRQFIEEEEMALSAEDREEIVRMIREGVLVRIRHDYPTFRDEVNHLIRASHIERDKAVAALKARVDTHTADHPLGGKHTHKLSGETEEGS